VCQCGKALHREEKTQVQNVSVVFAVSFDMTQGDIDKVLHRDVSPHMVIRISITD
jgi:hypothetical protein